MNLQLNPEESHFGFYINPVPNSNDDNKSTTENESESETEHEINISSDDGYSSEEKKLTKQSNFQMRSNATIKNKSLDKGDEKSNILDKYSDKIKFDELKLKKGRTKVDKADRATLDQVLDRRTMGMVNKLQRKGVIDQFNGSISTGKEANVYHGTSKGKYPQLAIKIYKTSILVFKDRDRYVSGEYRFRNGYSKHNPRKMVAVWAEKEIRNLKRIHQSGIPCPEPIELNEHVLVMELLGDDKGNASPKLKDAPLSPDDYPRVYEELITYMRMLYQKCRLVHADLSEYNTVYHKGKVYIIDVSQSVEHDHPRSLEFLRMDIKNVNDYFKKQDVDVLSERTIFKFITGTQSQIQSREETIEDISNQLNEITLNHENKGDYEEEAEQDDIVFRSVYIPQNLEQVYDFERDIDLINKGEGDDLVYSSLLSSKVDTKNQEDGVDDDEKDESNSDSEEESGSDDEYEETEPTSKLKKFEDKEAKKERKKFAKEEAKEKRQNKMKKHVKKKMIKKRTRK